MSSARCGQLVRLWAHECTRVFCDRLSEESEHAWFDRLIAESLSRHMDLKWSDVRQQFYELTGEQVAKARAAVVDGVSEASSDSSVSTFAGGADNNALLFADFADPSTVTRSYQQVVSDTQLEVLLQHYLREYNSANYSYVNTHAGACFVIHRSQ